MTVFKIFNQFMRYPLSEFFHLSSLLQISSSATSHLVVRRSALMITLSWSLSASDGWAISSSSARLVSFAKTNSTALFVSLFWAKYTVDVVSCLCCFMTCFEVK